MTAQIQEKLRFRDKDRGMAAEPLSGLFAARRMPRPAFAWQSTACWRGYVGDWEIRDDCLYLVSLDGRIAASANPEARLTREFGLADLFPNAPPGGEFADWVTDWLRVPDGELIEYVHMGYSSTYERDLSLAVHAGRLVAVGVTDSRTGERTPLEFTPQLDVVFGDEAAFLRAIHATTDPTVTKLVYADWLDERNDPRGELLRVDAELAVCADDELRTKLHTAHRQRALNAVKDWLWMKLVGSPLPRSEHGWELREW